jgi:hypothetical protein
MAKSYRASCSLCSQRHPQRTPVRLRGTVHDITIVTLQTAPRTCLSLRTNRRS